MKLHGRLRRLLGKGHGMHEVLRGKWGWRGGGKEKVKWLMAGDGRAKGYARSINLAIWMEWL